MGIERGPRIPNQPPEGESESSKSQPEKGNDEKISRREMLKRLGIGAAGAAAGSSVTAYMMSGEKEKNADTSQEGVQLDRLSDYAAYKLSQMEMPDFQGNDEDIEASDRLVADTFDRAAFRDPEYTEKWMHSFSNRIHELSKGEVSLREATDEGKEKHFNTRIRGAAKYLFLSRGDETRRVLFSPTSSPFSFDSD